jgi:regulation of enolase protein 1 (concanavalin A-like superfamily)
VSGPGTVSFADASATNTTVSFSNSGVYTLRLTADDGAASSSDDVVVTVNQAPVVNPGFTNAGPALAIALSDPANLDGSATDDGLPNPPGTLTYNWTSVNGPGTVNFTDANAASTTATFSSAGSYTLRLTASDSALSGSADLPLLVGGPLPSPWSDQDIGAVGTQGRGSFLTGTFIERGSGADIGGSADAFHYIYQPLNGDGKIIARIVTQYNSDPSAKAGVMIRENLTAGSKYAAVVITPSNGIIFQRRTATNGTTANTTATGSQFVVPYWLKLTRTGNSLATYYSSDGLTWTSAGSSSVTMGSSVFIGLAVTSHSVFNSTATIDQVNLPPIANAGPDQSITVPANTVTLNGSATDDGQPNGSIGYIWTKVSGSGTVTFGNTSQAVTTALFSAAGTYTLRLKADDGQLSATDDVVITVSPAAAGSTIRINSGGSSYTDSSSQVWSADAYFTGGTAASYTGTVSGTSDPTLYQSERSAKTLTYSIPVANGTYDVTLAFSEMVFNAAGQRVFNLTIEGQPVLQNFDIWALVGKNAALQRTFTTVVTDGMLNIVGKGNKNNAKLSAIQIAPSGAPTPTPTPTP